MNDLNDLQLCYDFILNKSSANETEILYQEYESATTRFSSNIITQNLSQKNRSLSIRVINESREGVAECNDLSEDSMTRTLNKAMEAAKHQHANDNLLSLSGSQTYTAIDNYEVQAARLSPLKKAEWIQFVSEHAKSNDMKASGICSNGWKVYSMANSKGLRAYHKYSMVDFNLSLEKGESSGWCEQSSYRLDNISLDHIVDKAMDVCLRSKSPLALDPGNYTVVLSPDAVGELLYFLAFEGLNTQGMVEKANLFHDKLGQKVFSEKLSIWDDAYNSLSGGLPFDFEGSARQRVNLIENGVFKERVLDRKLAKEFGLNSTGHALAQPNSYGPLPLNPVMEPGDESLEQMIAGTEHGLFVNRFHYTNLLDPMTLNLTGMTRDGLFLIEKGKITRPVKNFRFTESLVKAFNDIESVENRSTFIRSFFGGGFVVSGMKIGQFHFSSQTDF